MMTSEKRVVLEGGGYAVALTDQDGNVEITEHDSEGNVVRRHYGRTGHSGALLVPWRAESDDGVIGD